MCGATGKTQVARAGRTVGLRHGVAVLCAVYCVLCAMCCVLRVCCVCAALLAWLRVSGLRGQLAELGNYFECLPDDHHRLSLYAVT